MSNTTTIIPEEQEEKKEQILQSQKFLTWLEEKIPNIGFAIAIIISLMICLSISKYELDELPEQDNFIKFIVVVFKIIFDLSFVFSSLVTAKFVHEKKKPYAIIFISMTVFGFFYTIWRSVMYALSFGETNVITPENVEQDDSLSPITTSLIFVFVVASCLKVVFAEASAFMLYNSKTKRNTETSEMRNTKIAPKQGKNDVSQESEEETQGESYEIPEGMKISLAIELPDSIKKIDEDLYEVSSHEHAQESYKIPKDLEGWRGNKRGNEKRLKQLKPEEQHKAPRIQAYIDLYSYIEETIERMDKEHPYSNWEVHPNSLNPYQNVKRDYEKNDFYSGSLNGHAK